MGFSKVFCFEGVVSWIGVVFSDGRLISVRTDEWHSRVSRPGVARTNDGTGVLDRNMTRVPYRVVYKQLTLYKTCTFKS